MGRSRRLWAAGIVLAIIGCAFAALCLGRFQVSFREVLAVLLPGAFPGMEIPANMQKVVLDVRLPRVLLALAAGAGLSAAGAAFQALFANPLATPDTLGVATGASFGAVLGILFALPAFFIQLSALAAGLLAAGLVYLISKSRRGQGGTVMMVLAGMVISALFSALVSLVKYTADPQDVLPAITFWMMGNMQNASWQSLAMGLPLILSGTLLIFLFRWRLNALSLPEEEAASLGIPVRRMRALTVLGATMVTASVVSMCGLIGWVGLLIPHIARMLFGSSNKAVVPASIGLGAVFMLAIDTLARCASTSEIPVSILTAVIGAPFFILLLRKSGGVFL